MQNKKKQKLGTLLVIGLLVLAVAVPVMAATTGNSNGKGQNGQGNGTGICTGLNSEQREQMQARRDGHLKELVESGALTQADYDARVALQNKMEQYRDKLTDLTAAERQAKMKEYRAQALKELLDAGTITQAQYDQISAAPGPGGRGNNGTGMCGRGNGGSGQCGLNCNN